MGHKSKYKIFGSDGRVNVWRKPNEELNVKKRNLKQSAEKLGILDNFKYYQDNDPKHKAHVVREYLLYNCPKGLETPDINVIENLWHKLDVEIRERSMTNK